MLAQISLNVILSAFVVMNFIPLVVISVFVASTLFAQSPKVGVFLPLSGPAASWGQDLRNILIFANDKIANGAHQLIFEDDKCDSRQAVSASQKLIHIDRVDSAIGLCSSSVVAAGPIFSQSKVLLVAAATNAAEVSGTGPWVFRMGVSTSGAARILFQYLASHYSSFAILTEESSHSAGFARDFETLALRRSDITLASHRFKPGEVDFRTFLVRLKADDVPALVINMNDESAFASAVKQMLQLHAQTSLYGAFLPGTAGTQRLLPTSAPDITFVDSPLFTGEAASLLDEFKSRFGKIDSADYLVVLGFEAFRVIHRASRSKLSADRYLRETTFRGVFGPYRFNEFGDVEGLSYSLKKLHNGKVEVLEPSITIK